MLDLKSDLLNQCRLARTRLQRHQWLSAGIGSLALMGVVTAFAIAPSGDDRDIATRTFVEDLRFSQSVKIDSNTSGYFREERIQKSDSVSSLATRLGITDAFALDYIRNSKATQVVSRQLRPGKIVSATTDERGRLLSFYFPLNTNDAMLEITRTSTGFAASEKSLTLETQTVFKSGEIKHSLFGATDAAGISDAVAVQLAEIFSGEIDFYRDLRKGDRFSIVYETLRHQGMTIRSGRILAAEFVNNGKTHSAFWFQSEPTNKGGYYSADGKSLRKAFLRSPLEFSRVTSGFSNARLHPVLQTVRAHRGIDYGAPIGTRVRSVADGLVEFAGKQGGYGNLIIIKHQGAYSTAYGHLNGFSSGVRKGSRVSQGETIGFVGQTGIATGPHLHFEFRINSQQVNPLAVALPEAPPLGSHQFTQFKGTSEPLRTHLAMVKELKFATLE